MNTETTITPGDLVRCVGEFWGGREFVVSHLDYSDPDHIVVDSHGLHYNPQYLEIMETFEELELAEAMQEVRRRNDIQERCFDYCQKIWNELDTNSNVYITDFDEIDEIMNPES